ncbi:response regulator [Desulfobacula sp.]|uniref:hybrid sensor histidine kinase/response regulator n=1 Tax=Desulfobacula sp. TaxID=2593537 RepID=UPI0026342709|nr:response regulator [Desulfobacula sp.]
MVTAICLIGAGMYFFVLRSVSDFADEQIKKSLANIASEVYDICDKNFTELMQTGKMNDRKAKIIKKALTLGAIEEYTQRNNISYVLTDSKKGNLLLHQIKPSLKTFIVKHHSTGISATIQFEGKKYYFQHFNFKPWEWHIGLVKDTRDYAPLIGRVKLVYTITGFLLLLGLILILLLQERFLRRPLNQIIHALRMGNQPEYKGIFELEFLSDNISSMMHSLEEKNKWVKDLYLIAVTNRGEDFFNRVADALAEALDLNALILRYQKTENAFYSAAFSRNCQNGDTVYDPSMGLPNYQIVAEKKPIVLSSGSHVRFPAAQCLSEITAESYAGVPILDREGTITGTIHVFGKERKFVEWDINLIKTVGQIVAVEFEYLSKERDKAALEIQLQHAHKMEAIGSLAGGIAHDFNNILSGIFGYAQLGEMHIDDHQRIKKYLGQIVKGAKRASALVQQILTFSRQAEHEKIPTMVSVILKEALKLLRSSIPSSIEIENEIFSNATIMADPTQIHQVIMNLCTNAYQAMGNERGVLTVGLYDTNASDQKMMSDLNRLPGKYLKLEIRDTGYGMEKKTMNRIFDPYFTTKKIGKGTGLGLSTVDGIIKNHNGFITVQSKVGEGSVFHVFLPAIEGDEVSEDPEENETALVTGTEKIMLVDDEPAILQTLQDILTRHGYDVLTFTSAESALLEFIEHPHEVDLIITDMTMPQMTGDTFSREILKIRDDMPIIICTGYHEIFTETEAMKIGIKKFIQKPIMGTDLSKIIRELLDTP